MDFTHETVLSLAAVRRMFDRLRVAGTIAFDTETTMARDRKSVV